MISYELAKKLKDAGFPMKLLKNYNMVECPFVWGHFKYSDGESYIFPTLSELIEGCGIRFKFLKLTYDSKGNRNVWECAAMGEPFIMDNGRKGRTKSSRGTGSTPEVAVANLWLELNKK